jgi:uncharacterized membrane protein (UPF0127 family)
MADHRTDRGVTDRSSLARSRVVGRRRALVVLGSLVVATLAACGPGGVGETEKVTIGERTFTLKTAIDVKSREKGLGTVTEIPADGGMIFVFPDAQPRSFWMKDCLIDLDIAFLDPFGIVTAVHTMPKEPARAQGESVTAYEARLKKYPSGAPAQFAIELRPGTFEQLKIKRGSKITLDLERLKAAAK